jgi:hypothetical protein
LLKDYGITEAHIQILCNGTTHADTYTYRNKLMDNPSRYNIRLHIKNKTFAKDNYPLYSGNNMLINLHDASVDRELSFSFESLMGAEYKDNIFADAKIYWSIPAHHTMIVPGDNPNFG